MNDRITFLKEYLVKLNKQIAEHKSLYLDDADLSKIKFEARQLSSELARLQHIKE
jgi:hypothetical protein